MGQHLLRLQTVPEDASPPAIKEISLVVMLPEKVEATTSEIQEAKAEEVAALKLEVVDSLPDSEEEDEEHIAPVMSSFFGDEDEDDTAATTLLSKDAVLLAVDGTKPESPKAQPAPAAVTPSAVLVAEEKIGSSKPIMVEDKGKGPAQIEEGKKAIEDDTPLGEGPFDQELGGRKYRVHQAAGKTMGAKQLAEAIGFAEQLGYPSGATIFGGGEDDYLYCLPDSAEAEACRYMASNIGFPKLEALLSLMPFEDFFDCLAYTHLKGLLLSKALKNRKNIEGEAAQREISRLRSEVSELRYDCGEKDKSFKVLESDFVESCSEVQTLSEEKNKMRETLEKKTSEFEASTSEKDKRIELLEAELKEAKEKFEAETSKLKLASAEASSAAEVKIGDLNDEIGHLRQLNENYKILMSNCYTLGNRCQRELERAFTSAGATSRENAPKATLKA